MNIEDCPLSGFKYGAVIDASGNLIKLASGSIIVGNSTGTGVATKMIGDAGIVAGGTVKLTLGAFFQETVSVGTALIDTGYTVIADGSVTEGRKVYPTTFVLSNGAGAWTSDGTPTQIYIEDSSGVKFWNLLQSVIAASCELRPGSGSVTSKTAYLNGTGGTASKGVRIKSDGSIVAGNTVCYLTVSGIIK